MDIFYGPQPSNHVVSPTKDTQNEPESDKATEDSNLVVTHPRGAPKEMLAYEESQRITNPPPSFFFLL